MDCIVLHIIGPTFFEILRRRCSSFIEERLTEVSIPVMCLNCEVEHRRWRLQNAKCEGSWSIVALAFQTR